MPPETALVTNLAARLGYTEVDVATMLADFMTYGPLGFLPPHQRLTGVDPRLLSYLHFLKLAHLEGTLSAHTIEQHVHTYSDLLGLPRFSRQVIHVIFNSLPKPRRWHGGEGSALAHVRQRATLILDAPRLHQSWSVLPIQTAAPIVNRAGWMITRKCSILIVLDDALNLPLTCWPCQGNKITAEDLRLALYTAAWHPGHPDYPLRGIAERIRVPRSLLAKEGSDVERQDDPDLEQAAHWLATHVQRINETSKTWNKLEVVKDIRNEAARLTAESALTSERLYDSLLQFCHERYFPHHWSAPVPAQLRDQSVSLPGYDTPAAGWLLPVTGEVRTIRDGVLDGAEMYASAQFRSEPGLALRKREFPHIHPVLEPGLFVETQTGTDSRLHYLRRTHAII